MADSWQHFDAWPEDGVAVATFEAEDAEGTIFDIVQFISGRRHGEAYYQTENGTRLVRHLIEADLFRVRDGDLVLRKVA